MPAGDPLPAIERIPSGLYRHWKGALYSVISCGRASWAPGMAVVTYLDRHGELWHRPLPEWRELVRWPDGVLRQRFVPVFAGRNRRTVWSITTKPFKGAHFAVMPEALVEPCILAGTSERGRCPSCGDELEVG